MKFTCLPGAWSPVPCGRVLCAVSRCHRLALKVLFLAPCLPSGGPDVLR